MQGCAPQYAWENATKNYRSLPASIWGSGACKFRLGLDARKGVKAERVSDEGVKRLRSSRRLALKGFEAEVLGACRPRGFSVPFDLKRNV